mmetsp:Transcript_5932/g.8868  ORF Transcript_5932/g.8868 Transcript_5932/m.8868 type:complete len:447 (+) Transcript_5932:88-1428(+)
MKLTSHKLSYTIRFLMVAVMMGLVMLRCHLLSEESANRHTELISARHSLSFGKSPDDTYQVYEISEMKELKSKVEDTHNAETKAKAEASLSALPSVRPSLSPSLSPSAGPSVSPSVSTSASPSLNPTFNLSEAKASVEAEAKAVHHVESQEFADGSKVLILNGLVDESAILLHGIYLGACFSVSLMDYRKKMILLQIEFRTKTQVVVGNTNTNGTWGKQELHEGFPLKQDENFELMIAFKQPIEEGATKIMLNGSPILPKLRLQNSSFVKLARIYEDCEESQKRNTYHRFTGENIPDELVNEPLVYEEKVTLSEPGPNFEMLIGILSAPDFRQERGAQRQGWMRHHLCKSGQYLVRYFIGRTGVAEIDKRVDEEAEKTGDIIILEDVKESYQNIAEKTRAMFTYALKYRAKFLFKTDDDTYLSIDRVSNGWKEFLISDIENYPFII